MKEITILEKGHVMSDVSGRNVGEGAHAKRRIARDATFHPRVPSVVRRCGVRFATWCCGWRERTRGGAIHGLSAN
jgi:hypothetical protein